MNVQENIPLAPYTTLKIGGPARYFVRAETEAHVIEAVAYAANNGLPLFILGGGSNILVADAGFDGLVLQVCLEGIEGNGGKITAAAGEDWDPFVAYCVENRFAGLECLSGIPGFVGGTPVQNVGAYGQEVSETIVSVRCFDRKEKKIVELSNADCGFSYRMSIFNTSERERYIVLAVTFSLVPDGKAKVVYPELKRAIAASMVARRRDDSGIEHPFPGEVRDAVLRIRRSKSMVINESDPNSRSAGSFFKNPIVDAGRLESVKQAAGTETVPTFPAAEGHVKVPAAWLIERSGFYKGYRLGNAGISTNHSLALVNLGGASASEIVELKNVIQQTVNAKFGIMLRPEPIFVGFGTENIT